MVFNPLALLQERQCAPIYEALDSDRPAAAINHADQVVSTQPGNLVAVALRALALLRTGKADEANAALDKLVKNTDVLSNASAISALCFALNESRRKADEANILDAASKAHPTSTDFGRKACLALAYTGQWQRLQQTALRLSKASSSGSGKDASASDLYFWWSMQAYSLVSEDKSLPGFQLALPLAQRMISKHLESKPFGPASDEAAYLFIRISQKQGSSTQKEAIAFLTENETGKALCKKAASLADLRRQLFEQQDQWRTLYEDGLGSLASGDRNWATVQGVVGASVALASRGDEQILDALGQRLDALAKGNATDRTLRLAPLYFAKEATSQEAGRLSPFVSGLASSAAIKSYYDTFAAKGCTYEDLEPYACNLHEHERASLRESLFDAAAISSQGFASINELYTCMNAVKLRRRIESSTAASASKEQVYAQDMLKAYIDGLQLGRDLPPTEMQPADDFAVLAAQSLLLASSLARTAREAGWQAYTVQAAAILESALRRSPKGYRLRILLIRILLQLGAIKAAHRHYEEIGVKAIQNETLGWILSTRAASMQSLLKAGSEEERSFENSMRSMSYVWTDAQKRVPAMVAKTFEHGTFSRTEEMLDFGRRLEYSTARQLHAIEMHRHQSSTASSLDSLQNVEAERISATAARRDANSHDQRDRRVLLDLLPVSVQGGIYALSAHVSAAEPDEVYLDAMLDVCASAASERQYTALQANPKRSLSLTEAECSLHAIALALLHDDENARSAEISQALGQLDAIMTEQDVAFQLPSHVLHNIAIALEASTMVQNKIDNIPDGPRKDDPETLQRTLKDALSKLRDTLSAWTAAATAKGDSGTLEQCSSMLSKMTESASGGKSGAKSAKPIEEAIKVLSDGMAQAIDALDSRVAALRADSNGSAK